MNHGELWRLDDGSGYRLVLSAGSYNQTGMVISAAVGVTPPVTRPLTIQHRLGTIYTDKLLYHPREWLAAPAGRLDEDAMFDLHRQLRLLLELG
jgi:hypothetical protein